jgi:Astacin (Peptidase family M12A)
MLNSKLTIALLTLFACVSLGQTPSQTPPPTPTQTPVLQPQQEGAPQFSTQQHSYFDATAKWPGPGVYVCWENPDQKYSSEMALVRKSVADSWEAASQVRFTGWQKCGVQNRGIRILIDDSGPHTKGLGKRLDGVVNGMVLNFTFNNWSPACKTMRDACVKSIAVHEFGHGLGFAHEHNRPDKPGECQEPAQGANGTVLLTPYDPDSVMNYCNPVYNNNGILSRYDKEGVRAVYGEPAEQAKPAELKGRRND